ncbi:putative ATPase [Pseudokineococcus lusitanus]|uniref:Putative ATPase n=1 Tax=Pseudokineococcus lusitanus TaxID=763993 RepID=A0A3N1HQG5_9ACTN|nr:putative ATPase [Pseudokineococcus lusitanus]
MGRISQVRLHAFKNYQSQAFNLSPLTLLVGPNGSGKSNALDAFALMALLADERDVADLERADNTVAGLRGSLSAAAPYGSDTVSVGCSIQVPTGRFDLDIQFDVGGRQPEIQDESLTYTNARGRVRRLFHAARRAPGEGICDVEVYSGAQPKFMTMLTSRLVTLQAVSKVPQDTAARRSVARDCQVVIDALRNIFVLDPVPGEMRSYARIGEPPNRTGSTTSAVAYALRDDETAWPRLTNLIRGLVGEGLDSIQFAEATLPRVGTVDVMVALQEQPSPQTLTTASVMSDGTLRYLAIVATLLYLGRSSGGTTAERPGARTLLIEEVENGLYPAQAAAVLDLLRRETEERGLTLIATTHSPALLDALTPDDHRGVLTCTKDSTTGQARLASLVEHPNYLSIASQGRVGEAVAAGELDVQPTKPPTAEAALDYLDRLTPSPEGR